MKLPIIMSAFGTTSKAIATYTHLDNSLRDNFPQAEIIWAYSSKMITRELANGNESSVMHPEEVLRQLAARGITKAIVQSLHLFPGTEFHSLVQISPKIASLNALSACQFSQPRKTTISSEKFCDQSSQSDPIRPFWSSAMVQIIRSGRLITLWKKSSERNSERESMSVLWRNILTQPILSTKSPIMVFQRCVSSLSFWLPGCIIGETSSVTAPPPGNPDCKAEILRWSLLIMALDFTRL